MNDSTILPPKVTGSSSDIIDLDRINNPVKFDFLSRLGTWKAERRVGSDFLLTSKSGPKSPTINLLYAELSATRGNAEIVTLIEEAPSIADLLDTVQRWGPTIIKNAPKLEKEILSVLFTDIARKLDSIYKTRIK